MYVQYFVIGLHVWLVASVCEVELHVKKVSNLFVGANFDRGPFDLNTLLTSCLVFSICFFTVQANFIFKFGCN